MLSSSSNINLYKSRYEVLYNDVIIKQISSDLGINNVMEVPKISKIVLNSSYGPAVTDSKKLNKIKEEMALISGQRPIYTKAKRSLAGFHLREGMNLGVKVTLRKNNMYDFLDKLITIAMPRIKDFSSYDDIKHFDAFANFNFGLTDQTIFPEIDYDTIEFLWGMNVTIVTTTTDKLRAKYLLEKFNFPFKKDNRN